MAKSLLHVLLTIGFLSICALAQKPSTPKPADLLDIGTIKDSVYLNETLSFRLPFPAKMVVNSRAELEKGKKEGAEFLKNGGSNANSVDVMAQQEAIVLGLEFPAGDFDSYANMSISIKRDVGGDLDSMVSRTVKLMVDSGKLRSEKPVASELIGGQKFTTFLLSAEASGTRIYTKGLSLRRKGHLMTVSIAYLSEKGLADMSKVISQIVFF